MSRWLVPVLLVFLLAGACSSNDDTGPTAPPLGTPSIPATSTQMTPRATTASETASPTPQAAEALAAVDAAVAAVGGVHVSPLTLANCTVDNPDNRPCIDIASTPVQLTTGIAKFNGGYPEGGTFMLVMARTESGEWAYWYSAQSLTYLVADLPGELIACGGGSDVPALESPGGAEIDLIPELQSLTADSFVLVEPGAFGADGDRGSGYYHLTAPIDAWVDATLTADAMLGDCELRDAFEAKPHG
ncbi:MAG TPA: hypothetical protein VFK32_10310 [Tepidiformaceae bacterium]|nr:hypothetical protein [Tepidiformaceae bacterium]